MTSIVAINALVVSFVTVNEGMSPTPFAAKPISVLSLVHSYVVVPPVLSVENIIVSNSSPSHNVMSSIGSI